MSKETEKLIISPELRQRLIAAKDNGSTVAAKILEELKKPRIEIMSSNLANNFYSKRFVNDRNEYKSLVIKVGCCRKDFSNENNPDYGVPDAAERPSNQVWRTPSQFAKEFKNLEFTDDELTYFDSAIKETTKVTIKISNKFKDFVDAYTGANYSIYCDSDAPLHNSCMRSDGLVEVVADFYKNFAGCRIMIATNKNNEIVGRSIIWDGLTMTTQRGHLLKESVSFMDRKYYAYAFVRTMMLNYAKEHGIDLWKTTDDIHHKNDVNPFHDIEVETGTMDADHSTGVWFRKNVPHLKWHKKGSPYLDTMTYVFYDQEQNQLYLCNNDDGITDCENRLAACDTTGGCARSNDTYICPKCGCTHSRSPYNYNKVSLCYECRNELFKETPVGLTYSGKLVKKRGVLLPSEVAKSKYCAIAMSAGRLMQD